MKFHSWLISTYKVPGVAKNFKTILYHIMKLCSIFFIQIGAFLPLSKCFYSIFLKFLVYQHRVWKYYALYQYSKFFCVNFENFWGEYLGHALQYLKLCPKFLKTMPAWNGCTFWKIFTPDAELHHYPSRSIDSFLDKNILICRDKAW